MSARKLRVVESCPQPEPPPYRPIQYGWLGGHKAERITASPLAHEGGVIARVQSLRTRGGRVPEPLSYSESVAYLRRVERVRKRPITVPQPLHAGTPAGAVHTSPERAQESGTLHASLRRNSATKPPPVVAAARTGSLPKRDPAARVGTPADASPFTAPVGVQATGDLSEERK